MTVFEFLKGGLKEDGGSLHEEPHGEGKGQWVQVLEEVSF